ncbi:MAG: phosphate signaling complex protein PhoU [Lachnospiraceae bacterium]|nr:phosphate signaling complex protein PhoU [Lachnospiraceae bacterium]
MRNRFDTQLELLNKELIEMGALCEELIALSKRALDEDDEFLEQARAKEIEVDRMESDIENLCMKLLLKQQPVARDLRVISSALKMISDMERIGDQSLDIIEIVEYVKYCDEESRERIEIMANAAGKMVSNSVDAFVRRDKVLAQAVIAADDRVDELFDEMKKRLIHIVSTGQADGEMYIDLLMIAKYYERIGDHATNIAEWVLYSITGAKVSNGKDS